MKNEKTTPSAKILSRKAAIICTYAIQNPLHVFFEDGNFHARPMTLERDANEEFREKNGERMYQLIAQFLDEFEELSEEERREVYRQFRRKWGYWQDKFSKKVRANSKPCPKGSGFGYSYYLKENGGLYAKTDLGVEILMF